MRQSSIAFCALLIAGVLAIPAMAGFSGGDSPSAAATIAKSGILGGFGEQLKREDDEQEVKEKREAEPQSPQERAEAHEQAEVSALEAAQHDEREGNGEAARLTMESSEESGGEPESGSPASEPEDGEGPSQTVAASGENGAS